MKAAATGVAAVWACPLCRKEVPGGADIASRKTHIEKHTSHDPFCPVCHKHFSSYGSVREHLQGAKSCQGMPRARMILRASLFDLV